MKKSPIGKHITSKPIREYDWSGLWPIIDRRGYITGLCDGDSIPGNAMLADWSTNTIRGYPIIVDDENGFEAIVDPEDEQSVRASNAAAAMGSIKTEKKSTASRSNGRKGGRPRKQQ